MELRAEAERANAPAARYVGRLCIDPATHPAPAPKRLVGRPRASTHVQAPTAEPEGLLVLVQLSAHADGLSLQLFTRIPTINCTSCASKRGTREVSKQKGRTQNG
eukprot:524549-Pelagomonas_calceolata.AAC.5